MQNIILTKSKLKDKKYKVKIDKKSINFGSSGYESYINHENKKRKDNYIKRHEKNENWTIWYKNSLKYL